MLAVLPLLASLVSTPSSSSHAVMIEADAARVVGQVLTGADHVTRVHELPGAVAFDFLDDGRRWQLTVAIDDDGVVVDTALAMVSTREQARAPSGQRRRVALARVERIDRTPSGRVILRGGGQARTLAVSLDAAGG